MTRHVDTVAFALLALLVIGVLLVVLRIRSTERGIDKETNSDIRRTAEATGPVGVDRRLRTLSGTSDEIFAALYAPVLENARHCLEPLRTRVPSSHASRFEVGGMLHATTQLLGQRSAVTCHRYDSGTGEQQQPCWTYTYYCAVVCCYVLRALQSVEVEVSYGQSRRVWNPVLDPMTTDEEIQAVRITRAPRLVPGWRNILIISRLLPKQGLDWIVRTGDPFSALACTVTGVAATGHSFCKAVYDVVGDSGPNNSDHAADQNDCETTTVHRQQQSTEYGASEMDRRSVFEDRLSPTDKPAVVEKQTDTEETVFVLPESVTKTSTERAVVLNAVARQVVESRRKKHREYVFTYHDKPLTRLHNSAWKRAWKAVGLPCDRGILKGVHNLRHTFGRRLRGAGVPLETRKTLLGHANGDITTHHSAAELRELIDAVGRIVDRGTAQTPTLTVVKRNVEESVGKLSETGANANGKNAVTC